MDGLNAIFGHNTRAIKIIILLFLIVYHFTVFYSLSHEPVLLQDSEEYLNSANSFEDNKTFYSGSDINKADYRHFSKRTPLYPLVLYSFIKANLHINFVYLLQLFIGLFNIFLAFILLSLFFSKRSTPYYVLALFILFTPAQFIYSQFIMADLWLQTFVMMCMLGLAQFVRWGKSPWLLVAMISSVLAALTKPVFLIACLLISVYYLYYFLVKARRKWLSFLIVIPIFCWYSVSSNNQKLTGLFHYSSIGYINILHYNVNLYLNKTIGGKETDKILGPLMRVPHTKNEFVQHYTDVNKVCKEQVLKHFGGYFMYHAKGMIYFFTDPGRFDLYNFFRIETGNSEGFLHKGASENTFKSMYTNHPFVFISLSLIFLFKLIKTIGFIGFIWMGRKDPLVWVGAAIVFYIAFLTGPIGASRFALPVELIIMCFAAQFYYTLISKSTKQPLSTR